MKQSIHVVDLSADALTGDLDQVLRRIVAAVRQHNPDLVFIDSFRSVVRARNLERQVPNDLPQFVQQLVMLVTSWQATTLLIGEHSAEIDAGPVFTVAEGIIRLTQNIQRNSMVRKLEVVKLRGQATLPELQTFRIFGIGITVYAPAGLSAARPAVSADQPLSSRAMLAVSRLDDKLGGGLPRGYSLLVAGPSGSGKSILAASFLAEGAAVVKVRASAHSNELREYVINEGGIQIGEMLLDQEGLLGGRPTRKRTVDRLTPEPQPNSG